MSKNMSKNYYFLLLAVVIVIGVFLLLLNMQPNNNGTITPGPVAKITEFTVTKPNLIVRSSGLVKVEIWALPSAVGATNITTQKIGDAELSSSSTAGQVWTLAIPADPILVTQIQAQGYDQNNIAVNTLALPLTGETEIYNELWGAPLASGYEIQAVDSGRIFSYPLTTRFSVILDSRVYPLSNLRAVPDGIFVKISNTAAVTPPLMAATYEAATVGSGQLINKDFSVGIKVYNATSSEQYNDNVYNFSLTYPAKDLANKNIGYQYVTNNIRLRVDLPYNDYMRTNLGEASVMIGATRDPKIVAQCLLPSSQVENEKLLPLTKTINGVVYNVFQGMGVGAGNFYDSTSYRTVKNNICYEVVLLLHSSQILNYPAGLVREFEHDKMLAELQAVADNFKIK